MLRYRDVARLVKEGGSSGDRRFYGTIEAMEGADRVWVKGEEVSLLVDLSLAPLYVLEPGPAEAGSLRKIKWSSVSSLVEGTRIFVGGHLVVEGGQAVFVDAPDEGLIAVCHEEGEGRLASRLIAAGRGQNEYWNYFSRVSIALGVVVISSMLLGFRNSALSTVRALIFLAGVLPVLPFAPPGLALYFAYRRLWRRGLALRTARDLIKLPLSYSAEREPSDPSFVYERRVLAEGQAAPEGAVIVGLPASELAGLSKQRIRTLFVAEGCEDPAAETTVVEGVPELLVKHAERRASLCALASGLCFALAAVVNFALIFMIWRAAL
jgi:hypothetical protein